MTRQNWIGLWSAYTYLIMDTFMFGISSICKYHYFKSFEFTNFFWCSSGKTSESRLIHTSPLFLMSATPEALFRVRFIPLAESENIFRKRILSALSMPSFYRNWIIVIVCYMDCPLVKLRNFRDCRTPRQD